MGIWGWLKYMSIIRNGAGITTCAHSHQNRSAGWPKRKSRSPGDSNFAMIFLVKMASQGGDGGGCRSMGAVWGTQAGRGHRGGALHPVFKPWLLHNCAAHITPLLLFAPRVS